MGTKIYVVPAGAVKCTFLMENNFHAVKVLIQN